MFRRKQHDLSTDHHQILSACYYRDNGRVVYIAIINCNEYPGKKQTTPINIYYENTRQHFWKISYLMLT